MSGFFSRWSLVCLCGIAMLLAGCGGDDSTNKPRVAADAEMEEHPLPAPPASTHPHTADDPSPNQTSAPEDVETAESLIGEILLLRTKPLPESRDLDEIQLVQHERNEQTIELAMAAIAKSHDQPNQQAFFEQAVNHLAESRLQLALNGDRENIDALYEEADTLLRQYPNSRVAADAAYAVCRFAHTNARRFAKQEPRWIEEFARQARLYVENFPGDRGRAIPLLYSAGRSCELHQMTPQAIGCYKLLLETYPDSEQGQECVAFLRRLQLEGQPLKFAGPTIRGDFISIDQYQGKVVCIVYCSSEVPRFLDDLSKLKQLHTQYGQHGFEVIAVNLDENDATLQSFLKKHTIPWQTVFYSAPDKRGWKNPLCHYYGVRDIPAYWVVDRSGRVVTTSARMSELPQIVLEELKNRGQ